MTPRSRLDEPAAGLGRRREEVGYSLLEVVLAVGIVLIVSGFAFNTWQQYTAAEQLKYGAAQVAASLREAEERARAERAAYTVTFNASSSTYTVTRSGGGYNRTDSLTSVTPTANTVVTFSAFGVPDAAHTIFIQNTAGTRTASVSAAGGITY